MGTEDRLRALEDRIAELEAALARQTTLPSTAGAEGLTLRLPVRLVDGAGTPVIELREDSDGGLILLSSREGELRVTMGCHGSGGWLDVIQAGTESLAVTLTANDEGGTIEYTRNGASFSVDGEQPLGRTIFSCLRRRERPVGDTHSGYSGVPTFTLLKPPST